MGEGARLDIPGRLVESARRGDRIAMERLLERLAEPFYRLAASRLGSGPDAEDAAQEALLKVARGLESFRGQAAFSTWSYTVAWRAIVDRARGRKREARDGRERGAGSTEDEDPLAHLPDPAPGPVEMAAGGESRAALRAALERLPEEQRDVVVLRLWEGLSFAVIAEVLACPVPTAQSRMARALERLRGLLDGQGTG